MKISKLYGDGCGGCMRQQCVGATNCAHYPSYCQIEYHVGKKEDGTEFALIHSLYVSPSKRKQGVAHDLLNAAIAEIRKGYSHLSIEIDVEPTNPEITRKGLVKLYKSVGFKVKTMEMKP